MTRNLSRRRFVLASLGAGGIAALAACGETAPPTPVTKIVERIIEKPVERVVEKVVERQVTVVAQAPAKAKLGPTTLTFWGHDVHPVPNAFAGFEEKNPGVKMKFEPLGDWLVKFRATLASGTDVPDLVWLEEAVVQDLGHKGVLLDTTEIVAPKKELLSKGKLAAAFIQSKGKYFSVPGDIGLVGLWHRQDVLAKAGIKELPKDLTLDDFAKLAVQVKKETDSAAFVLPKAGYNTIFQVLLSQNGGSVTTPDLKVTIDDDKGIKAMTQIKQLYDTGAALDAARPAPTYWAAVKGGKLAADFAPAWVRGFYEGELKAQTEGLGEWRIAPLPKVPDGISRTAQVGGAMLTSTKFTKAPEATLAFQDHAFMTLDGATAVGSWGIIPSYLPYLDSPIFSNLSSPVFGQFKFARVWGELGKELSSIYVRTAVFPEAMTAVTEEMMPMVLGQVRIADGMKKLGDKVRQANERYK